MPSIINLAATTAPNAKTNELKIKTPKITNLARTTAVLLLKVKYLILVI